MVRPDIVKCVRFRMGRDTVYYLGSGPQTQSSVAVGGESKHIMVRIE